MLNVVYKFQGGKFNQPVFASIFQYLPVNTAGMENTHMPAFCQPWFYA